MARAPSADPDQFGDAVDWHRKRVPITDREWDRLKTKSADLAFKVAGVSQANLAQEVFDAIDRAVRDGTTLADFKADVGDKLADAWGGEDAARLETVFRTNVLHSYNAGRDKVFKDPAVRKARPYLRFDAVGDDRTCFAAGTPVRLANGADVAIETIRPGDRVLSCRGVARRVLAVKESPAIAWVTIALSTGERFTATPNHPIMTAFGWIRAGSIRAGDRLAIDDGQLQNVWDAVREGTASRSQDLLSHGMQQKAYEVAQASGMHEMRGRHGDDGDQDGGGGRDDRPDPRALRLAGLRPIPAKEAGARGAFAVVASVQGFLTETAEPAYDIQVESDSGLIVTGVVVHNSDICDELDGTVLPADDPFWLKHTPPLHFSCRSILTPLSDEEADDEGIDEAPAEDDEVTTPDEGFGVPASEYDPDLTNFSREIREILRDRLK